jgi:hypothetical protein
MGKTPKNRSKRYKSSSKYIRNSKSRSRTTSQSQFQSQLRLGTQSRRQRRSRQSRDQSYIRELPLNLSQEIRDEYNTIALRTQDNLTPLLYRLDNRVHFIFLFAGNAYVEQIFVSFLISSNISIESISFVDLHYNENNMQNIRRGFPGIVCMFYGVDELDSLVIHPNSICLGIRPQIIGESGSEINRFIARYYTTNHFPIYLVNYENIIRIEEGEDISHAIRRLYHPQGFMKS